MICRMNLIHCEFANGDGYCVLSACGNPNIVGNTIKHEEQKAYSQQYVDELKAKYGWHTGTPTEDGWYLCAYDTDIYLANYWVGSGWLKQYRAEGIDCRQGLLAWQKIEPYRG